MPHAKCLGKEKEGISCLVLFADLEVEARVGRTSGIPYIGNGVSFFYPSTQRNKVCLIVGIHGIVLTLVFENQQISVSF